MKNIYHYFDKFLRLFIVNFKEATGPVIQGQIILRKMAILPSNDFIGVGFQRNGAGDFILHDLILMPLLLEQ